MNLNLAEAFPDVEIVTWVDHDQEILRASFGGLRFRVSRQALVSSASEYDVVSLIMDPIVDTVRSACDGLEWCSGIWDIQWTLAHGAFHGELLG